MRCEGVLKVEQPAAPHADAIRQPDQVFGVEVAERQGCPSVIELLVKGGEGRLDLFHAFVERSADCRKQPFARQVQQLRRAVPRPVAAAEAGGSWRCQVGKKVDCARIETVS